MFDNLTGVFNHKWAVIKANLNRHVIGLIPKANSIQACILLPVQAHMEGSAKRPTTMECIAGLHICVISFVLTLSHLGDLIHFQPGGGGNLLQCKKILNRVNKNEINCFDFGSIKRSLRPHMRTVIARFKISCTVCSNYTNCL